MAKTHCFTSISFSYLDRARVLAETIKQHHPDWTLWLCMSDLEPDGFEFDLANELFDHIVRVWELDVPSHHEWVFKHDVVELCTAVKGPMLQHILAQGAERVYYIDPDIAVFQPLVHVEAALETRSIVLTPHLVSKELDRQGVVDNEISCLKHGTYNLGFLAVRNDENGRQFSQWWGDRLREFCYDDIPAGLFTDQRWCDLAPALFDGVFILRDAGYNVASWNLSQRPLTITRDGQVMAADVPLRFFHFTKVNSVGEISLDRAAGGHVEVFELLRWYRERLNHHAAVGLPSRWWHYSCYEDGTPVQRRDRLVWRERDDLRRAFDNPFASGPGTFQQWCMQHLL